METKIVIIGGGPGGYVAAVRAAQLGADVTLIEKENVGGTCLNWGCIPSKIMKNSAELLEKCHQSVEFGLTPASDVKPDMARLMARKEKVISGQIRGIEGLLKHNGVTLIKGTGRVQGPGQVVVTNENKEKRSVSWDRLILATGTRPLRIPAFPFDGERILSSNDVLCMTAVPESMVIVGGGVIGCEFACILSGLGAQVTVVEALDRLLPLPSVDEDISKVLTREMKKRKIKIYVNRTVESVNNSDDALEVTIGPSPFAVDLKEKDKKPIAVTVEKVLVAIGREPLTHDLGLENIGVATDNRGWVNVNPQLQTSVPHVFAIGDVLGPAHIMLAHAASAEAMVAAENAMGANFDMDYHVVPGAMFTMPESASVGLTEAQAKGKGLDVRGDSVLFRTIGKAQVLGELAGQAKIVSEKDTGIILGVHLIGPHATDLIAEGALAVKHRLTAADVAGTIHAHPTLAEIMMETALKASDRALHG